MSNSTSDTFDKRLVEEKKLYESFTTFEQLCSYGAGTKLYGLNAIRKLFSARFRNAITICVLKSPSVILSF